MPKRLIDTTAGELSGYSKKDLLTAIAASEGRTLAAETIGTVTPMLVNITNAEFVASLGADLIMLNIFDVNNPVIQGLLMIFALQYVLINLIVDMLYGVINPKIRYD